MSTDTKIAVIEQVDVKPTDEVEKEKLRHIINPPANLHIWKPGMSSQDIVDIARVRGLELVALCGKKFIPTQNPLDMDTCDACLQRASDLINALEG